MSKSIDARIECPYCGKMIIINIGDSVSKKLHNHLKTCLKNKEAIKKGVR